MDDNELRELFAGAARAVPGGPLDWETTIVRARRSRILRMVSMAAAAAVVVAAIGAAAVLVADRDGRAFPPVGPSPTPSTSPGPAPTPTSVEDVVVEAEDVFPSVDRFLEAAAGGDARAMWEEMSGPARASFGDDLAAFEEFVAGGVAEGLGSWAEVDAGALFQPLGCSPAQPGTCDPIDSRLWDGGAAGVVTLVGHRVVEGTQEPHAVLPLPIRIDAAGDATIEWPLDDAPLTVDFVAPPDLTPAGAARVSTDTPTFEVLLEEMPVEAYLVTAPVPDEPAFSLTAIPELEPTGGRIRATARAGGSLFPGEFFLTVVVLGDDGVMRADATRFFVDE